MNDLHDIPGLQPLERIRKMSNGIEIDSVCYQVRVESDTQKKTLMLR